MRCRFTIVLVLVVLTATADAQVDRFRLRLSDLMMDYVDELAVMMGPSFTNGGLFFTEPSCVRFNKPATIETMQDADTQQALREATIAAREASADVLALLRRLDEGGVPRACMAPFRAWH